MSISSALHNAYSGLTATSKTAETISNNVSNALTEGYSRQIANVTASVTAGSGTGVRTDGISRSEDIFVTTARRSAESELAGTGTRSDATAKLAALLGEPGDSNALASRISAFENSLRSAQASPDSVALQNQVVASANLLTKSFNALTTESTRVRVDADANIARQVSVVNSSLKQIEGLNAQIRMLSMSGRSVTALEDKRQMLIDTVNTIIPIRQSNTGNGEIAVYSKGGAVMLHGTAREIGFDPSPMMTQTMTIASGGLSGLTLEGQPVAADGALGGGSLEANFDVRDKIAPTFQTQIDGLALDLVNRFQNPAVDPTLAVGDPGLFTDAGAAFTVGDEIGLSGRLQLNSAVDPANGGAAWRIRDGINAVAPGFVGDDAQLRRLNSAMSDIQAPPTGLGTTASLSSQGFASELTSVWSANRSDAESQTASAQGGYEIFRTEELSATGVDTDREMQHLMAVEQAFAANAKVISIMDELMNRLLEM